MAHSVRWEKRGTREWSGDTDGYGRLRITAARPKGRAMRFYLMTDKLFESPIVLGDFDSLRDAQDSADAYVERIKK